MNPAAISEDGFDATRSQRILSAPWGWRECLAGVGVTVVALVLLVVVATVARAFIGNNERSIPLLLTVLAVSVLFEVAMFTIAYAFSSGRFGGGAAILGWHRRSPMHWLGYSLAADAFSWITLFAYTLITQLPGLTRLHPKSNVPNYVFDHAATAVPAVLLTVLIAPICEETFFRGFIFGGLRRRLGFAGAATLSGTLFAVAHGSPGLIIPFTVIGVIFACTYERSGTLWASATAHLTFNLVSVIATLAAFGRA